MNSETPPSSDPLFGNNPSDLMREAMDPATRIPTGDPYAWQPPTPEDLQARLGGAYLVQAFLARGGMGVVYRGIQASLERPVAIKILPPQLRDADPSFAQRFKQEAKAMAQLNHPSIVSVYDFGEMPDGTLYFIMEFVDGTDVAQMVTRQGRLSSAHAMAITAHVCDALQYAHEHGVVHRDIKPANIMVGNDGRVKVADFGLAKSSRVTATSLTMTGHVMGTPHFLAPEALTLGSSVDHRADIYAVGVMLYQMLTGRLPKGIFEMPSLLVPGLDPRYDAIITAAMREDRTARYQAILDMRRALDAILTKPVAKSAATPQQPASAAPPAQAAAPKPQPGQHYYRPPQAAAPPPRAKEKSNTTTRLLAAAVVLSLGGIVWMKMGASSDPLLSATKEQPFINSLGMKFVPVPGTNVLMCQHETRRQDYEAYANENSGTDNSWQDQKFNGWPAGHQDDHPVVGVSWNDAKAFCEWLSKKEGVKVRLPTDKEWSQAAGIAKVESWENSSTPKSRSNVIKSYTWGPSHPPKSSEVDGNYGDVTYKEKQPNESFLEGYNDGFSSTSPVGSFNPNGFGLFDIGGNAREWIEDEWEKDSIKRVLRGSAWHSCFWNGMATSSRHDAEDDARTYDSGFRCVIEAPSAFPDVEFSESSGNTPLAETATQAAPDSPKPNQMVPIGDLVFPTAEFANATIPEVIEYFQRRSRDLDPAKEGITFLADEEVRSSPARISMSLKNITLVELIGVFARLGRLEAELSGNIVSLRTSKATKSPFPVGTPNERLQRQGKTILPTMIFEEATIGEAAEFIRYKGAEAAGDRVNIVIDPAILEHDRRITLLCSRVSISNAIAYIANLCDGEVAFIHDTFYLQPNSKQPIKIDSSDILEFAEAGKFTLPTLSLRNATISEAVEFLTIKSRDLDPQRNGTDIEILVDDRTRKSAGKITLDSRDITIANAIYQIALLAGVERYRVGDAVCLKSPADAKMATAAPLKPDAAPPAVSVPPKPDSDLRTFTDRQGRRIRATLIRVQNDDVTLKREDGQEISIKGSMLSDSDIGYLKPKGLVLPRAPVVAATTPAAPKPPAPVVEPPKPAAVPAPSAPTTYGGMEFSPNWLPQTLSARRELLESYDFYCKAVVGNAPKGQEPVPDTIVGAIRWRMPIDEAIRTLPKGFNKLSERPMVHSCLPNNSLINCGFQYRSFQDRGQSFYEMFMLIDKQRRVVSVMFRDNGKDIQWFPKPDGIREPYYNMFSELTYNGSTTQEVPYQILGAGNGVTCIKTALRKKIIALPNMPNMPQMAPSGGGTKENVHWYLPAPFARSILDIVDVYRARGVIK